MAQVDADETPSSRKPGSKFIKLRKLRTNRSALTSSTIARAIWSPTRVRWKEKRSRPEVVPRNPTSTPRWESRAKIAAQAKIKEDAGGQGDDGGEGQLARQSTN